MFRIVKRNRIVFGLASVAAAAMVLISEGSYWRSVGTLDELGSLAQARAHLQLLTHGLLDAETGQRGYLVTGRKEYRAPYDQALQRIGEALVYLERYYGNEPAAAVALKQMRTLTEARLSELELTIRLYEQGKAEAAREIVLSDIGKENMDAIRALGVSMLERETRNVAARRGDLYQTLLLSRAGIAALSLLSLLALYLYLRQTFVLRQQQLELQRMVQVERDRLEEEVIQRTAQLTELTHHLQTAREDERQRLARNLHDDLGALLTSAKLDAARIKSRIASTAPEALELLAHLVGTLNSGIALGRSIIEDLRPSALSNLGLVAALEILAREFATQSGVQVHCELEPVRLQPNAELMVFRLVQEAITNISKYAKAGNVWIRLGSPNAEVEVSVRDDGVGFDTSAQRSSAYGLLGMRYRVTAEGGQLTLASTPGQGTLIRVTLPQSEQPVQEPAA